MRSKTKSSKVFLQIFKNNFSNVIKERNNYYRELLKSKDSNSFTPDELGNIARVLYKSDNILEEEIKKFDEISLNLVKILDNQQLRRVMNFYIFTNRQNKYVFYEIKERNKLIALKDYTPCLQKESGIQSAYIKLFHLRNRFFKYFSKVSGIELI